MQGTVFMFQICAVAIAFNSFTGNGEKDDGIWNGQSLSSALPRLPKAFDISIRKGKNITCSGNLFKIKP